MCKGRAWNAVRFGVRDFRRLITAQRIVCGNAIQQLTGASIRAAGIVYRLAKIIDICSRATLIQSSRFYSKLSHMDSIVNALKAASAGFSVAELPEVVMPDRCRST